MADIKQELDKLRQEVNTLKKKHRSLCKKHRNLKVVIAFKRQTFTLPHSPDSPERRAIAAIKWKDM